IGRCSNEHRASLRTQLTILLIRVRNRTRAADELNSKKWIFVDVGCRRELADDVVPVSIHLIREYHRQGSLHSLAKLETVNVDSNLAVRANVDERVRRIDLGRLSRHPCLLRRRSPIKIQRHDQATSRSK